MYEGRVSEGGDKEQIKDIKSSALCKYRVLITQKSNHTIKPKFII